MLSGHISLIPKSLVLSQPFLSFSANDHIFLPKKSWDMWSDRPEYLEVRTALEACTVLCPDPGPAQLLHIILTVGSQLRCPPSPTALA